MRTGWWLSICSQDEQCRTSRLAPVVKNHSVSPSTNSRQVEGDWGQNRNCVAQKGTEAENHRPDGVHGAVEHSEARVGCAAVRWRFKLNCTKEKGEAHSGGRR